MPSVAELKAKYPDLGGLDDEQVVDAVHEAFYQDLPREQVAASLGVKPAPAPQEPRTLLRTGADAGLSLLKGAIAVPEAAVGLADIASGGRAGQLAESAGFRPKEAKAMLDEAYSDQQKAAFQKVQAAQGLGDTFVAAVQNPSVIAHSVVESLPSMAAGGVLARGGLALAPKLAPVLAGALGEGVVGAGSAAEQIRQGTGDGLLTGQQSGLAAATGALTTGFGMLGGKIAKRLGIADVDTMLTGAATYPAMRKGVVRSALEGAVAEGVLEELPQSISEQVLQNMALDRPLDEGVNQAAVLGLLSGAAMGGGANVMHGFSGEQPAGVVPAKPAGPLARAATSVEPGTGAAMEAAAAPPAEVDPIPEPVDDPMLDRINALPDGTREEAQRAYGVVARDDVAKGVKAYNKKLLDRLLSENDTAEGTEEVKGDAQPAVDRTRKVDPETGEIITAYDARNADAPKQLEGDILNAQNKPFTNMGAAKKTAQALGADFAPIKLSANAFVVRKKEAEQAPAATGEWANFEPQTGTKGIPRADMPQIKAEHRGAMVNFLNARGITHEEVEVPPASLKPTQAEYSVEKVRQAMGFTGGDRSILISSDNHVLDGHHQWIANGEKGDATVKAIRLNAPIEQLIETVKEFPSAETADSQAGAAGGNEAGQVDTPAAPVGQQAEPDARTDGAAGESTPSGDGPKPVSLKKPKGLTKDEEEHLFGVVQRKTIPEMTDADLVKMQAFYPADHKRAPKIAKEIARRAQAAKTGVNDEGKTQEEAAVPEGGAVGTDGGTNVRDAARPPVNVRVGAEPVAPGVQSGKDAAGKPDDGGAAAGQDAPVAGKKRAVSANTVFTEDAAAAARATLKKKLSGTLNSGIDPELLQAGLTLAGYHVEKGARTFAAYAKAMLADLGDGVKPYLKSWYMAVKYDPRAAAFEGMDAPAAMETVDLDKLGSGADTGGPKDGNATRQLDQSSTGSLEGAPSEDVRAPGESRDAGAGPDRSGGRDGGGDARAGDAGGDAAGSVGAGAGTVPVPARGARAGAQDVKKPRVPRARRADEGPGLFGDAGGVTPEAGVNPAPNAPAIAAPQVKAEDFTITDELALGEGGQKAKFKNNVAAIGLLAELESTGRLATPDEQAVLAKYVGWGGLPQAFDAKNADWAKEHAELTALMSPEELAAARQSTRYAHYTSREIIADGIYAALRRFGFNGGKTLEAGAGVGNFMGLMPADMRSAGRFTAIEREPFSSAIARQLYPQQNVQQADFTEFRGTDAYYDAAVGNPPFASDAQTDRSGRKHLSGLSLHNYFFAKSVDMLREGGIMAQVITNAFMDSKTETARKYIGERVKFLGAIRMPNNAFSKNAGTDVTTDLVFLQKRPDGEIGGKAAREDAKRWLTVGQTKDRRGKTVALNKYFIDNPGMMLGEFGAFGGMYGPDTTSLQARPGQDTLALLKEAVGKLPEAVYRSVAETGTAEHTQAAITALKSPTVNEGGYFMEGDKLMQRLPDLAGEARGVQVTPETQWTEKTKLGDTGFERIKALAGMRSTVRGLIAAEMGDDAKAMKSLRATLNQQYDAYRETHGLINDPSTLRVFEDDPDFPLLASLEHGYTPGIGLAAAKRMGVKPTKSTAKKGPIFTQRVVAAREKVQKVDTPADALQVSMAERGKLDAGYIGELLGMEPDAVLKSLSTGEKPLLFRDPASDEYVLRDAYLSGNVRAKLAQAQAAGMFSNVAALEAVQPPEVQSHEIVARIGSPWVPTSVYSDFANELFGEDAQVSITYLKANSSYQLWVSGGNSLALSNTWGTPAYPGDKMLNSLLNNRSVKVTYTDGEGKSRTDVDATEMANTKAQEMKDRFNDWLFSDPERSELLTKAYNETNNNYVTRVYDGSHMTFPGKVPDSLIKFRRHQRNAIARTVQDRTALLDHVVGSGKTFTIVASAMELKRTGLARKPMVAVPNHLVKQWAADFYRLYPGANVLTATKKDFEKANRRKFLARIATGDWDAVVIAHSSYGFIKPAPEFEADFNSEQVKQIMATIQSVEVSDGEKATKRRTIKQLEAMKERLENRIRSLRDKPMDDLLDFEQIGVDQLFVDEAHMFKNLMFSTKMQQVQGLGDSAGSQRAYDMYVKAHQIYAKNGRGQGVVFATGTPVSNSLAEMYHMMRYLMPSQMKELGFESFDAWANTFASVEQVWMQAPSGDGFKASNRMSNFVNTTELLKMFDQVSDTVTMDDIKKAYSEENNGAAFPLPKLKGGRRTPVSLDKSKAQDDYMAEIAKRAKLIEMRRGPPKKGDDNILVVMGDARKAAMDIRLVDPEATEREKGGRIDTSSDQVLERYHKYDKWKGTQLVFSDMGTPIKHAKAELKEYEALQARIQAGNEDVAASATLGNEAAMGIMEDVEAAQAELDAKGQDWLSAVQSALRGFSVYDDFKAALIEKGIPEHEIAFIHDYNTDDQKANLFRKMNAGQVRVLLGSTQKLGAGTNVQERLVALHHLDVPWRPSDVEQREGRIERQGNILMTEIPGFEIEILAYVTKDTLDMRMWQVQETKLKMINQLRSRQISREIDNAFEDMELSAGEMQAAATGDINLLKEIQIRNDVKKLEQKRRSFEAQRNDLISRRRRVQTNLADLPGRLDKARADAAQADKYLSDLVNNPPEFKMEIDGKAYTDAYEAQTYLRDKTEAKIESTNEAGEKVNKAAPVSIEINGETFKSRAAIAEAFAEARGDMEAIRWDFNGTEYRRRTKLATALRQNIVDAIADEAVKPLGTIAGYEVQIEGHVVKNGVTELDLTLSRDGKVALEKSILMDHPAQAPERVVRVVENLLHSAVSEVDWLQRNLDRAKKEAAELESVTDAGAWPEEAKLEAARAAHKAVLAQLKKKEGGTATAAAPADPDDEVMFSRSATAPAALKPVVTPVGTAFQSPDVVLGKPRLNVRQPGGAVTRIDYELRDPVEFAKARAEGLDAAAARDRSNVGILTMDVDKAGQFKSLRNIEVFESKRGSGMAEKVVGAIMGSLPETAKLHVYDILPTAVGFWDKMGAKFPRSEDFMEAFLTPAQYRSAYDTRTSAAGKKGSPDESGETLFSRGREGGSGNDGKAGSQKAGAGQSVEAARATAEVERHVQGITSRWANAPEVVVVYDMSDERIPEKVRQEDHKLRSGGTETNPDAFFHRNKVYLVASQIPTAQVAAEKLLHESLGHYGLRGNFGGALKPLLTQLAVLRKSDIEAKAKEYGLNLDVPNEVAQAAEEVLAEMAQTRPEIGYVKRAIAIIRTWLRRNVPGFKNLKLTDDEIINNYILPARGWVERAAAANDTKVSKTTASDSKLVPEVAFSRSLPQALAGAMNNAQDVKLPAGYIVNDFFKANGKLNWWHKTVGTQYNLAERNPTFKKVFDGVQSFINDVSFYASEAADLAPSILPKMESWKDITKSPISAADNKAIAAPIFEGTLVWMRDGAGKPVKASVMEEAAAKMTSDDKAQRLFQEDKISEGVLKMWRGLPIEQYENMVNGKYEREFLKPGIVFKPAELKSLFKLTDRQVELYNEFRAATDKSLTDMAVADMVRFGGTDVAEVRDQALAMGDVDAAAVLLRDHLLEQSEGSERAGVLQDTASRMIDKADRARDLMDRGYAPLSRFGANSLDVVDENGERVYFGLFESKPEANKMARQMRANFPNATISQGTMSDEEYKLFAGVSPETVELFGEMLGLEAGGDEAANQAFQQYLKLAKANRSAMKRLIQRKGIAGFSEDPGRVLAGFVYSNARQTSSGLHMGGITQSVKDIPKGQGELKDAAMQLMDYVKNPQEEAQKIRGLLFAQYLGGSIASALVNLMQPLNITFPWLSQYGGITKAAVQMKNAVGDALKKSTGDKVLDAALKKAEEDGIVSPQEVFQLMAQAQGKATLKPGDGTTVGDATAKASNAMSKLSLAWGKVFGLAEQFNRRTTFIAAYRTAVDQGMTDPAAFAERAVQETQFVYNKGAKPKWARGAVGGVLFTFKSYSINYVEMLSRMAASGPEGRKAALLALAVLFLMSGAGGLPFAEDLDDVVDGVMQRLGYNFSSKQAKQEFFTGLLGRSGAQFVERGISGLAGVPIDVSGRLGMGNLIPGTGLLTKKQDHSRDLLELTGPAGDLGKRAFEAAGKLVDGNITGRTGALATMSPTAVRNVIQAVDMGNTGMYRDVNGKKVIDTDGYDVLAKAIGFQPNDVARVQDATRQVQNMVGQNKMRESEIAAMWAQGVFEGDQAKVQQARDALKRWNEANPAAPIKIQMPQIIRRVKAMREDKATRIAKTAPKEIRASVRKELAENRD
jgi:N12 class adenine-specific DNA methylase